MNYLEELISMLEANAQADWTENSPEEEFARLAEWLKSQDFPEKLRKLREEAKKSLEDYHKGKCNYASDTEKWMDWTEKSTRVAVIKEVIHLLNSK